MNCFSHGRSSENQAQVKMRLAYYLDYQVLLCQLMGYPDKKIYMLSELRLSVIHPQKLDEIGV